MLEIHYIPVGGAEKVKTYETANDFLAAQYLEVPELQDNSHVTKVLLDGQAVELQDKTVAGLFDYLNH